MECHILKSAVGTVSIFMFIFSPVIAMSHYIIYYKIFYYVLSCISEPIYLNLR